MNVIIFAGVIIMALLLFFLYKAIDILKKPKQLELIGQIAIATGEFGPNREGIVRVHGEYWKAQSKTLISSGQKVRITGRQGLLLFVEPLKDTSR